MTSTLSVLLTRFLSIAILVTGQNLQCNELQNVPLCEGDVVISTCKIQSPVVLWIIEADLVEYEIDFNARNNVGDIETDGVFSANLTKHYPEPNADVSESILRFEFTTELNGTTVHCQNLLNLSLSTACVIGNSVIALPSNVGSISTVQKSCEILLSWNAPSTGAIADHYVISLEPLTNQCGAQGCNASTDQTLLTGLENGVNYDISITACNCFGCGPATTIQNVAMNLTETELINQLIIDRPVYTVELFETGYAVVLYWEETLCVTSYSVNVTYKNSESGNINSTLLNTYTHTALTRGTEFNVNVAGVNGNITGPYSPELCIKLEVPGNVTDLMAFVTRKSSGGYLLVVQWKSPRNITCTQPSVDYYIFNFNKTSSTVLNTSVTLDLPSTTKGIFNVTIIPVNIIGTGISRTTQVFVNGAIKQMLSTMNLILVVIGLLILL